MIEKVSVLEEPGGNVHYLPHHAVIRRDAETTKLRIVYDASSKETKNGTSLNDCLHTGPSLNPLLFDILVRFRENKIALLGDIENAFLNVAVDPEDRDRDLCGVAKTRVRVTLRVRVGVGVSLSTG